jgi:hypothetical protein
MKEETTIDMIPKEKPYVLKKLGAPVIFSMCKIIKGIGINEFKTLFGGEGALKNIINMSKAESAKKANGKSDEENANSDLDAIIEIGAGIMLNVVGVVIENLPKCENDIYKFLSMVSNLSEKEVKSLSMADFTQMIIDVIKKEDFADFIKVVFTLFK